MYNWVVFLHMLAVFAFLFIHGVSARVMFQFRYEEDPERSLALFNLLPGTRQMRFLVALVVITGLIAGFMGNWWGRGWIWASLGLLAVVYIVHKVYVGRFLDPIEETAERAIKEGKSKSAMDAFVAARASQYPIVISAVGITGILIILWLMMFKPF